MQTYNYRTAPEPYLRAVLMMNATTWDTLVAQNRAADELQRRGLIAREA